MECKGVEMKFLMYFLGVVGVFVCVIMYNFMCYVNVKVEFGL